MGSQVTMVALQTGGPYLVGDSPVTWDEAAKKNVNQTTFDHYERREYSEQEATDIIEGKVNKLITDGYIFEVYPDMKHFVRTGQLVHQVHEHR